MQLRNRKPVRRRSTFWAPAVLEMLKPRQSFLNRRPPSRSEVPNVWTRRIEKISHRHRVRRSFFSFGNLLQSFLFLATEPVPLTIRPSHFAHSGPTSAFAPPSTSAQSFMVQQPSIPMPPMPVRLPFEPSPFGLQFMPFQMHPAPVPYCQSGPFPVVLTQLNLGPSPHLFGQAAAHRQFLYGIPAAALAGHPMMAPHPAPPPPYFSTVRMPMPMPGHPQAGMPYMVPQPELAIPTMDSNDRQSPRQPISTDSGIGLNSTTSSTLYTDAPPFVPKPSTSGATPSTSQAATAFAPSETPSATSASVSTRPSDIAPLPPPDHTSFDEEKQSSKNDSQQQQVGDLNGPEPETAAGRVPPTSFQSPIDTQAMEAEAAGSTPDMENYINTLKLECRTVSAFWIL